MEADRSVDQFVHFVHERAAFFTTHTKHSFNAQQMDHHMILSLYQLGKEHSQPVNSLYTVIEYSAVHNVVSK